MSVAALLAEAARAGLRVWLEDGLVRLEAGAEPAPELLAALRENRTEITEALSRPSWTDLDAWCSRLGAAGDLHARREVVREWAAAAGGWSDPAAVHLPTTLPAGLALARLKAHARGLGLAVRVDHDAPELSRWLRDAS